MTASRRGAQRNHQLQGLRLLQGWERSLMFGRYSAIMSDRP